MAKSTVPTPVVTSTDALFASWGEEMALATDTRATILTTCRLAYEGMLIGVSEGKTLEGKSATERRELLSELAQRALQHRYGISDDEYAERSKIPANRPGGIGVSPSAIKQRAAAYSYVIRAGLTPDILNVTAAFRMASITGKGHAEKVDDLVKRAKSGEDFVTVADSHSDDLTAARKGSRAAQPNDGTGEGTPLTADAVAAVLSWAIENAESFTPEQRDALSTLTADLGMALV